MAKYLLIYHGNGDLPATEAEGEQLMAAWGAWFGTLGDAVIDGGNPVGASVTLYPGGRIEPNGGSNPATGYGIIEAPDLASAQERAAGCPVLAEDGGSVELAPIIEL